MPFVIGDIVSKKADLTIFKDNPAKVPKYEITMVYPHLGKPTKIAPEDEYGIVLVGTTEPIEKVKESELS